MEKIIGKVIGIIFEASDSSFKVINAMVNKKATKISGFFPFIDLGLSYEFEGEYELTNYGLTFKANSCILNLNQDKNSLIEFLSSALFNGVGKVTATKIVDKLGINALDIIANDISSLDFLNLKKEKQEDIYQTICENIKKSNSILELLSLGLSYKICTKIIDHLGAKAYEIIKDNPYILMTNVKGFSFKKADSFALSLGISPTCEKRIMEGILYSINSYFNKTGSTIIKHDDIVFHSLEILDLPDSNALVENGIEKLIKKGDLVKVENELYTTRLYKLIESELAKRLLNINNKHIDFIKNDLEESLCKIEARNNFKYAANQKKAIKAALENKISIITGGPGTGKTTIIKAILEIYLETNVDDILLLAPTGRAAKRMASLCNHSAKTIHKALEYDVNEHFNRNQNNKLSEKMIIIDEASMIDLSLAYSLFISINDDARVIILGDVNQLPSVLPGNFLQDIISSRLFATTFLDVIFRQKETSNIVYLAHDYLNKKINYDILESKKNVYYYSANKDNILDSIKKMMELYLKGGNRIEDIKILAPIYSGEIGIDEINKLIQQSFNITDNKVIVGEREFRQNDLVLQLTNDPKKNIMNGDIGKIIDFIKSSGEVEFLKINFDGNIIAYPITDIDDLTLAYSISIHKAQGSEFDNIILPILPNYQYMMKHRLIYTAMTRAKNKLIIFGQTKTLINSLVSSFDTRHTSLIKYLVPKKEKKFIKINNPDIPFEYLGEDLNSGITPYSFMEKE